MTDLPVPDDVLDDWLCEPKIKENTMKYLISYYYKNDLEMRYREYSTMKLCIDCANLLIAKGDYVVDSITTQYS